MIDPKNKEIILQEFDFIMDKMNETGDIEEKMYYFSGTFGILHRIFNINYQPILVVMHHVLQQTHAAFLNRITAMKSKRDRPVHLTEEAVESLDTLLHELYDAIEKDEDIHSILDRFLVLIYSTTGNGYYLLSKGILKV